MEFISSLLESYEFQLLPVCKMMLFREVILEASQDIMLSNDATK